MTLSVSQDPITTSLEREELERENIAFLERN